MDSPDRADFLSAFKVNGKYQGTLGVYRHNSSTRHIGVFDKEIIDALAPSVKWIAHNGAGYDQIDVEECLAKGKPDSLTTNERRFHSKQAYTSLIPRKLSTTRRLPRRFTSFLPARVDIPKENVPCGQVPGIYPLLPPESAIPLVAPLPSLD